MCTSRPISMLLLSNTCVCVQGPFLSGLITHVLELHVQRAGLSKPTLMNKKGQAREGYKQEEEERLNNPDEKREIYTGRIFSSSSLSLSPAINKGGSERGGNCSTAIKTLFFSSSSPRFPFPFFLAARGSISAQRREREIQVASKY